MILRGVRDVDNAGQPFRSVSPVELLLDVLNLLNDAAEEAIATDNLFVSTFGRGTVFMGPRRVMLGARMNLGN